MPAVTKTRQRAKPAKDKTSISRRYAGLKPAKPGEVRNPLGISGATKRRATFNAIGLDVMGRPVEIAIGGDKLKLPGDEAIWLAMRNKAIKGDVMAATWVRDTLYGKPLTRLSIEDDSPPRSLVLVMVGGEGREKRVMVGGGVVEALPAPGGNGHDGPKALTEGDDGP